MAVRLANGLADRHTVRRANVVAERESGLVSEENKLPKAHGLADRRGADSFEDTDDEGERGCAWLMPPVLFVCFMVYLAFFIIANSEPIHLSVFPHVECLIRPPTLVLLAILIGIGLTFLWSWVRHRVRLAESATKE